MLSIRGLQQRFGAGSGRPVLDIAELEIGPGRLTVITGPSGSGKTTLLYVLSGLLRVSAGAVIWDKVDLATLGEDARDRWRRRQAGFVFQNFHLIEEMSALDNVTVAANFGAFSDASVRARGATLLETFGVPVERRRVETYSRGEQQRVALARALLFDPPIMFADEPTASLDTPNAAVVAERLVALAEAGKTVIAVSHDRVMIDAAATLVALDHGRLAASPGRVAA